MRIAAKMNMAIIRDGSNLTKNNCFWLKAIDFFLEFWIGIVFLHCQNHDGFEYYCLSRHYVDIAEYLTLHIWPLKFQTGRRKHPSGAQD